MNNVSVLVGAQWGDEGKGKWIDILAKDAKLVARYQGGNNAGHTLYVQGAKVVLHQIPSGIFQADKICALTAGVVINPAEMVKEISKVQQITPISPAILWLSARAHVISPWSIYRDGRREAETSTPIGTTKRGIGPTYSDKAARVGLRLGDFCHDETREQWLADQRRSPDFAAAYASDAQAWKDFEAAAAVLVDYVCDAEARLREAVSNGEELLLEGAQGVLLDLDHGTYPYVTSSTTASGGAFASLGFSPRRISQVIGVSKAYVTRVGEGPMPTELFDDAGKYLAERGNEFGATTGRPRRCGWLDGVALRYAQSLNGFDALIVNKLDVLTGLEEIKLCVAYQHPKLGRIETFPWDHKVLNECQPVYETFAGWSDDLSAIRTKDALPKSIRDYLEAIEATSGSRVRYVGTGVHRTDFIPM